MAPATAAQPPDAGARREAAGSTYAISLATAAPTGLARLLQRGGRRIAAATRLAAAAVAAVSVAAAAAVAAGEVAAAVAAEVDSAGAGDSC